MDWLWLVRFSNDLQASALFHPIMLPQTGEKQGIADGLRYHATSSRHSCRTFARMSKQSASGLQALPVRLARFIAAPSLPSSA
jgi:hypothetical protein